MQTPNHEHTSQLKRKVRQLNRIDKTWRNNRIRDLSPRQDFARLICLAVVTALVGIAHFAIAPEMSKKFLIGFYGLVALSGFLAYRATLWFSKKPWSYESLLDSLLTRYEPVDVGAYRQLQQDVRRSGSIGRTPLWGWLDAERLAVRRLLNAHRPDTTQFQDKEL